MSEPKTRRTPMKDLMAKAEANELVPVPLDPFDDEAIKQFSRQKLIDLANSDNATAARQAASELLERTEPKGVPKQERLSNDELRRQNDIFDEIFKGEYCDRCHRGRARDILRPGWNQSPTKER